MPRSSLRTASPPPRGRTPRARRATSSSCTSSSTRWPCSRAIPLVSPSHHARRLWVGIDAINSPHRSHCVDPGGHQPVCRCERVYSVEGIREPRVGHECGQPCRRNGRPCRLLRISLLICLPSGYLENMNGTLKDRIARFSLHEFIIFARSHSWAISSNSNFKGGYVYTCKVN